MPSKLTYRFHIQYIPMIRIPQYTVHTTIKDIEHNLLVAERKIPVQLVHHQHLADQFLTLLQAIHSSSVEFISGHQDLRKGFKYKGELDQTGD